MIIMQFWRIAKLISFPTILGLIVGLSASGSLPSKYDKTRSVGTSNRASENVTVDRGTGRVAGGHWEYVDGGGCSPRPYNFSLQACRDTALDQKDCDKEAACQSNLMNYQYIGNDGNPYPRFDVRGFREKMRNRRILFVGCSLMRQQVQALVWTLGYQNAIEWDRSYPTQKFLDQKNCTATRNCMVDDISNTTICLQFMGSMATEKYQEGNFTLDHSKRGHGDSSCLLEQKIMSDISEFDVLVAQSVMWWTNLPMILGSPTSPSKWVSTMIPRMYYDAMEAWLSGVSQKTKTFFVLGHVGSNCQNKTEPEPYSAAQIPPSYGWQMAPTLWNTSLKVIEENGLEVQIVDARVPLMQAVNAHPDKIPDCAHFCMESAAINIYLDIYWNEVFSQLKFEDDVPKRYEIAK